MSIDINVKANATSMPSIPGRSIAVSRFTLRPPTLGRPAASLRPSSVSDAPREFCRRTGSLTASVLLRGSGRSLLLCKVAGRRARAGQINQEDWEQANPTLLHLDRDHLASASALSAK